MCFYHGGRLGRVRNRISGGRITGAVSIFLRRFQKTGVRKGIDSALCRQITTYSVLHKMELWGLNEVIHIKDVHTV